MLIFTRPEEWGALRKSYFDHRGSVGYVPTMGALHQGHQSLIERAVKENEISVCSIFVNPTQFDKSADLQNYPRTLHADLTMAEESGCDAVFVPEVKTMYGHAVVSGAADYGALTSTLEGAHRPGHFDGVVTIVRKLFAAVEPDRAYFGEKDFQQLAIIRELVKRESLGVDVVSCKLIRDVDGLALSSRNVRLSPQGRMNALAISDTLRQLRLRSGEVSPEMLAKWGRRHLAQQKGIELEYLELINEQTFDKAESWDEPVRALVAVCVDGVRLIDNMLMSTV